MLAEYMDQGTEVISKLVAMQNRLLSFPGRLSARVEKKFMLTMIELYEKNTEKLHPFVREHFDPIIANLKKALSRKGHSYADTFLSVKQCTKDEEYLVNPYLTKQRKVTDSEVALWADIPERLAIIDELIDCGERQMAAVSVNFGVKVN